MKESTVDSSDGVVVSYDVRGAGAVTLVFIHCWACDRGFWDAQIAPFEADYRVLRLDLGGHGRSTVGTRTDWSLDRLADDVVAAVDAIDAKRVLLIGHSLGGPVAVTAAARLRGRAIGVIGVDTLHDAAMTLTPEAVEQFAASFERDYAGTMGRMVDASFAANTDPKVRDWVKQKALSANQQVAVGVIRGYRTLDLARRMREARVPIRCINAAPREGATPVTNVEGNRALADFDAELVPGVGHFLYLEQPAEFGVRLGQLVRKLAPTS